MNPLRSIRLTPNDAEFLNQRFNNGDLYYDASQKTLVLYDGQIKGGIPFLRADLSNIAGGSGGAGNIDFGAKTITAQAFVGDGSLLTGIPIPPPPDLTSYATKFYADSAASTAANTAISSAINSGTSGNLTYYSGTNTLDDANGLTWNSTSQRLTSPFGTITDFTATDASITNLTVTGTLNASISITSLGFALGVVVNEFSSDTTLSDDSNQAVPTEHAVKTYVDTEIGALDLSASGTVNTGFANQLAYYQADGNAVNTSGNGLLWNPTKDQLRINNLEVATTFATINDATIGDSLAVYNNLTVGSDLTVAGRLRVKSIFDDATGIVKFVSGSDFIIDAPGEVNVSGSRIANVATPIDTTDAVNKAYVDAASSQFSGGTVPNAIKILSTIASTSTITGSLQTAGGLGVGGDGYFGGTIYVAGSPVLTSASGSYNGGTITGALIINNNTASTSTITGALRVVGGAGFQGNLNVGGSFRSGGVAFGAGAQNYDTNVGIGGGGGVNIPLGSNVGGQNNIAIGYSTQGQLTSSNDNVSVGYNSMGAKTGGGSNVAVGSNTLAQNAGSTNVAVGHNSQATGATGDHNTGVGYNTLNLVTGINNTTIGSSSGSAITTGNYNLILGMYDGTSIATTSNNIIIADGQGNIRAQWASTGKLTHAGDINVSSTTVSTSKTDGALTVGGGLGVAGDVYATGFYGSGANLTGVVASTFAGGNVAGITNFTSNTASTTTGNGGVVISNGLGVGGAINSGSTLTVAGTVSFTQNSAASSTTTGTLRVTGGIGATGNVYASAFFGSGANLTGITASTATTATNATNVALTTSATASAFKVPFANTTVSTTGNYGLLQDSAAEFTYNPSSNTLTVGTVSGALSGTASNATTYNSIAQATYSASIKSGFNITGGGLITVNASSSVLWATRFIVISNGNGATFSTSGYFDINCPVSGTVTGVGGHANVTATAAGITMGVWDALYYILPTGSAATSLAANFRIATYSGALDVPHNWVLLAVYNGDDNMIRFCNGIKLKAGESSADTYASSANTRLTSLGVGTAASGTAGEIRATSEITAYYASDRTLKENITPIDNALGKLRQLTGVMFDWTDEELVRRGGEDGYFVRKHDTGVIAQDVEVVLPEVVATREDGHKAVRYEKMAGLIIQAINELADQVDEIKKKLG